MRSNQANEESVADVAFARTPRDVRRRAATGWRYATEPQALENLIGHTKRILSQKQKDKNKLYVLHAPEVKCQVKGNARKLGVKVPNTTTHKEGPMVGACSMPGNPYDGHALAKTLEQAAILSDAQPQIAVVDRDMVIDV